MSADGRLDLDELGEVIDHASALDDPPRGEVIDDGNGRGWAERLEDAGVTPWLRRHRVVVGSVTAVVVLAAAGVVAVRALVPPPVDPVLRVNVTAVVPAQYVIGDSMQSYDQVGIFPTGRTLRSAYALTRQDPADTATYTITGLSGPGVRATSASRQPAPAGDLGPEVARQDVDVVLDCFDVQAPLARDSYKLLVTRTDERGRTLSGSLPLDADPVVHWPAYVTATCLQTQAMFALTPTSVQVSADRASNEVAADVTVSNTAAYPAVISSGVAYGPTPVVTVLPETTLVARRGGVLPLRFELRDCANPFLQEVGLPAFPGDDYYYGGEPGVYLESWFPSVELDPAFDPSGLGGRMQTAVQFTPGQAEQIDAALASLCEGAPDVRLDVGDIGTARTVTGVFPDGNVETTRLPLTLVVDAPGARRVRTTEESQSQNVFRGVSSQIGAASAGAREGRARVRTWLDADCQMGYVPPPVAQLEVTTSRGTFPVQVPVDDAALTEALAASCSNLPVQQLVEYGWADPRVP